MIEAEKKKYLKKLAHDVKAYIKAGNKIKIIACGESDIAWRTRLNPDASKINGERNADLDSKKRRKPKLSD